MKLEFKPEDFPAIYSDSTKQMCAEEANKRLAEMLKDAVVVYSAKGNLNPIWMDQRHLDDTHKALLIDVQPIFKETCRHENLSQPVWSTTWRSYIAKCECGVELVAEWKPK